MMETPRLTRLLTLEEVVRTADGAGGFTMTWSAKGQIWADIAPGSGRDTAGEEVTLSTVPYRITVRAAPFAAPSRPRPDQRFREGLRLFRILAVTERDGDARYLTCFAREEAPE
jgi:head-tail adaptor